jgi:hypothetical protein
MHWSYQESVGKDLAQGDILLPSEELRGILNGVHPWFNDPKYLGFIIISQTCDLVRRDGVRCKTPYIEIAVVRGLRGYRLALFRRHLDWLGDRYFPIREQSKARELLERIMNQNESGLGLFYLHPEASIGIAEESVALLRVSIALRAEEHYGVVLAARRGTLHAEFANRLGWLCGNLYSRVGVRDWTENEADRRRANEIRRALVDDGDGLGPKFVQCSKAFLDQRDRGGLDCRNATAGEIERMLAEFPPINHREVAINAVDRVLKNAGIEEAHRTRVLRSLLSDPAFCGAVRNEKG